MNFYPDNASDRLRQAIDLGMVVIPLEGKTQEAHIVAPLNHVDLSDDDWLAILNAASEMISELEALDYTVYA